MYIFFQGFILKSVYFAVTWQITLVFRSYLKSAYFEIVVVIKCAGNLFYRKNNLTFFV